MGVTIERGSNPYSSEVQGKANEPITVMALLDQAAQAGGVGAQAGEDADSPYWSLTEICDRLEANAPRIAVIGGSPDHPAHIVDRGTILKAARRIWQNGGVPFSFSIPVVCDGTAQSHVGMCYSLQSRNAVTSIVVNQMEGHAYHGAFVVQGCDKTPLAVVNALAVLDVVRRRRGDAPVFATFCPAHVLRGGTIPDDLRAGLEAVAIAAEQRGCSELARDLRDTLEYILQCSSNQAFQGILSRAVQEGLIDAARHKEFEQNLAANTCEKSGGICAFNGTGNSSRHVVSALGLVHPAVEFLTVPPAQGQVDQAVDALFAICNLPDFSVSSIVVRNIENAIRVHSTTGGSTNLMMHIVSAMIHCGYDFNIETLEAVRTRVPVPDLFDYSLTRGRDIFALASQCSAGKIRGMETVFHELLQHGVPMSVAAPTVTGTTWEERLSDKRCLAASGAGNNPIILSAPRRLESGVDVLRGNFFESAVVKTSGMTPEQISDFDEKIAIVLYFENEEDATAGLLNTRIVDDLGVAGLLSEGALRHLASHNGGRDLRDGPSGGELLREMADLGLVKLAVAISGQGPEAYGMPEMFTPMQHINSNRVLRRLAILMSDGRYSGVTYGAAIGHMTPEAKNGGGLLYLRTGDLILIGLRRRRLTLLDTGAIEEGVVAPYSGDLCRDRTGLGEDRLGRINHRLLDIAPTNRLCDVTDAAHGVAPRVVAAQATQVYQMR